MAGCPEHAARLDTKRSNTVIIPSTKLPKVDKGQTSSKYDTSKQIDEFCKLSCSIWSSNEFIMNNYYRIIVQLLFIYGVDKRAPPVGDSWEVDVRWTKSKRASSVGAPRGGHGGQASEVARTWRRGGTDARWHHDSHVDGRDSPEGESNRVGVGGRGAGMAQAGPSEPWHGGGTRPLAARDDGEQPG
uniref:Uncharacterized protein n=1 Tax=Oryza sativa subsp. japonica TaxID=39947 RepID=Q2QRG1_ORYSJ|nr:hypothetical protein LOC_Os12g27680 [Oryza sativa Japonica Group]